MGKWGKLLLENVIFLFERNNNLVFTCCLLGKLERGNEFEKSGNGRAEWSGWWGENDGKFNHFKVFI